MIQRPTSLEILEDRITPAPVFSALNLLSGLDGENGFNILGGGGAGVNVEISEVANAGDVNGDGIKDLLVGIPSESSNSKGRVALIFGQAGGFPANLDLDALGTNGVVITGQVNFDRLGTSLAGVGDVNGDGFDDVVIGAPGHDVGVNASERGAAYVVFGKASWGATLALASLDGTNGFKIVGDTRRTGISGIAQAVGGYNLAGAGAGGDFNGDGFDDVLIGGQDIQAFNAGGADSGAAFIIFGKNTNTGTGGTAFTSPLSVANLTGTNGLMIGSSTASDFMGSEVGFVGDVNGDGLTDISIGNMENPQLSLRRSFIIFGKATGNPASIDLNFLTADQGFAGPEPTNVNFVGPISYGSEYVMRDIDNDGDQDLGVSFVHQRFLDDAIQGYTFVKNAGAGYTTNPFGNLSKELRTAMVGFSNVSVDAFLYDLGDFNGDGFYDLSAFPSGFPVTAPFAGIFEGVTPTKTYIANNGTNSTGVEFTGLQLPGGFLEPRVFFVGDISGDGIDDALVLPAPSTGTATAPNAYVVFGDAFNPSADGKSVTLRDIDGDAVTVKTSAGQFTRDMFTFSTPPGSVPNGQLIDLLDLTVGDANSDAAFAGASLTVSVKKGANGDGRANVGAINATGIDLGNVVIAGGIESIDAGNATDFEKPSLAKLDVYRFGGVGVPSSDIVGRIGSIIVDTTFENARINVTGSATEGIGSVAVAGDFSGVLALAGPLDKFKAANLLTSTNIDVNGTSTKKASFTAKSIADGVIIDFATQVGKFTATQVGTATITAARIDTISITGDTKLGLPGSFAGDVISNGAGVGSMTVKENFSGELNLTGSGATLDKFKAFDLLPGAIVRADGTATKKTSITAHVINDGVSINIGAVIGKLSAARIGDATILADRIDSLSVNGDTKLAIAGDFAADLTLDNAGLADGTVKVLGTVKIAGRFHDAKIVVAGTIGSFTAAAMQTASLFAGYTPTNAGLPLAGGTFLPDAELGKFNITGKVALAGATPTIASMDDSFVVANRLGAVSLQTLDVTTGALQWGFAYRDAIKSLKATDPAFIYHLDIGGTQATDDFSVRQLP